MPVLPSARGVSVDQELRLTSRADLTAASVARPPAHEGRALGHSREKPSDRRRLGAGEELRPYQKPGARQGVSHHWRGGRLSRRQVRHRPTLPVYVAKQREPARVIQASLTEIYGGRPMLSRTSSSDIPPRREVGFVLGSRIIRVSRSSRPAPRFHGGTGLSLVCDLRAVPLTILADAAARRSGPAPPGQPKRRDRGRPGAGIQVTLFSSGWRKTPSTWRRHSGRSSRKRTSLWAHDISPGGEGVMGAR
jgi:hypothetical protein